MKVFSHEAPEFTDNPRYNRNNGAYWYSVEIGKYFIPTIKTDRNWVTLGCYGKCFDHSIVFAHSNLNPEVYSYLEPFDDLLLICSWPQQMDAVKQWGKPLFLPMSVDVDFVKQYRREKDRDICFAGRAEKCTDTLRYTPGLDFISEVDRHTFLTELARYKRVYAIDRVAIEAKVLGCEVLPYDDRFPDPDFWEVIDSRDAAKMLQGILNEVDS